HGSLNAGKIYFGEGNVVKLGEFGLALLAQEFATLVPTVSLAGISRWMSPELFDNDNALVPTTESDIWALGCTLYEILTRKLPYSNCIHDVEIALTLKHEVRRTERQTQATLDPNAPPLNQLNSWITQLELELTWDSNRRVATRTWTAIPVVQGYPLTVYTGTGATNAAAQADAAGKIIASNILNTIMED
ncbi:G2-specific serine/threonine protein kinase, partial [Ceratobasidium sp. 392]